MLTTILRLAPRRLPPTAALAQDWNRAAYSGVPLPVAYYAGEIRDSDPAFPELDGYEVVVGRQLGAPSSDVPLALTAFETRLRRAVDALDRRARAGAFPETRGQLVAVLRLAAVAHGEWVRIHPFANGNGRTARLWANWCGVRYGLPPFVRLHPRPEGSEYALAAEASMAGDHRPMTTVLARTLTAHLASG